jgi:hypothetical protein
MTALEMVREFKIFIDKVDSQSLPDFTPTEIYLMLNEAQERYIKTHYGINNLYKAGFEMIQKRTDDLSNLVVTRFADVSTVTTEINTYKVSLDSLFTDELHQVPSTDEYMFFIRGRARHNNDDCNPEYIYTELFQQDDLEEAKLDPFNKPDLLHSVSYFEAGSLYILTDDSYTVDNYKLTFLRHPLDIAANQDCELKSHTHKEIIQLAVEIALENIESIRLNTQNQMLNKTE